MNDTRLVNVVPIVNGWKDAVKKNLEEAEVLIASGSHLDYTKGIVKESVANLVLGFADDLLNAPAVDPDMHWISVNDPQKHPQHEKKYIVNLKDINSGERYIDFAEYDAYLDAWCLCDGDGTLFGYSGVGYCSPEMYAELTYWMEQPQPPKEDNNA